MDDFEDSIERFDLSELKISTLALIKGETIELSDSLKWLTEFDAEDLQEMLDDIHDRGSVDDVDYVIHEWHESALVIQSGVLNSFVGEFKNND